MESRVAVVTVPFPAQGHLNQLLHLSLLLASRGLPVHFAAPEPHLGEARARLHGWDGADALLAAVRFRRLEIPACASPSPDPSSPFPTHILPLFEAFCGGARAPLAALLMELSTSHRRVVVLHDRMAAFAAAEAARLPNGESLGVHCLAASYNVGWADPGHRLLRDHGLVFHPPGACATPEFVALAKRMGQERRRAPGAGMVVNTCRAIEGEFLDVLAGIPSSDGHKLFAVGPLNPVLLPDASGSARALTARARHECLDWLDKQPPSSVLYVSFGTTSSLREEQVRELAAALRGSGQRFIWVLRDADLADMREAAANARLAAAAASELGDATARGAGVVVTGWAPQLEILAHGATAAFMSHCGWNSTVESLSHGKPVLAWPMHSDQPWDAELVCKYLGAGVLVRPWEERYDVTPAAAIRVAIERVMASDDGAAMRCRAAALGEAVRAAVADGGSARRDLDDLVAYMTRCVRNLHLNLTDEREVLSQFLSRERMARLYPVYDRLLPCPPVDDPPRIEHLVAREDALAGDFISKSLDLPPLYVADLIKFGAVYYALVAPQPPPYSSPEHFRIFKEVTQPSVLRRRASIKGKTVREAQKTFRVTDPNQRLEAGTYVRVHVHPKRFPRCYEIDWKSRVIAVTDDYVVLNKPAATSVGGATDNIEESCAVFTSRALGLETPLLTTHQIDNCSEGCVILSKTKEFCSVFHGLIREKQVKKLYLALTTAPVSTGIITHYMRPLNRAPRLVSEDHIERWYLCQMEILDCTKIPWPSSLIRKAHNVNDCGWPEQEAAYECKINLITGKTHQIRAQLAAMGTPIIGDSAYMTAAMAAMANPSINPFGRERLSYNSEEEKEAAVEAWVASHGKEPKSVIGLQASEISWDCEGEHHYYKAGVPWWRQDSVESDLV
ncbi:hypothetical protein EJB05_56722, partial [Eragrostis curvula]